MKYRLLALDVDGTLVSPDQTVPPETVEAIRSVAAAGVRVCLATGRSYGETFPVWQQLKLGPPLGPLVLVGGALISEGGTGRTLYQRTIDPELAALCADALSGRGYSALAIVDAWRHGVDYLVVEGRDIANLRRRWLAQMKNVRILPVPRFTADADQPSPLRISALIEPGDAEGLLADLHRQLAGKLMIQSIFAPNYGVTVLETFAASASKWSALEYIAAGMGIGADKIVAVGDDVNDLSMIRSAGLGAAMAKAPEHVKAAARHVIAGTLAEFIREFVV